MDIVQELYGKPVKAPWRFHVAGFVLFAMMIAGIGLIASPVLDPAVRTVDVSANAAGTNSVNGESCNPGRMNVYGMYDCTVELAVPFTEDIRVPWGFALLLGGLLAGVAWTTRLDGLVTTSADSEPTD